MQINNQFVTKKELYSVAVNICVLVAFAGGFLGKDGFSGLYATVWALSLAMYYVYKLISAKVNQQAESNVLESN